MRILWFVLAAAACAGQPPKGMATLANQPKIELKGVIEKVQIMPGQGMPFMEVKNGDGLHRVALGSMRYLMEKNFNPKAGAEVIVKGYKLETEVVASRVELPSEKAEIQLRDDQGYPLWRMGQYGKKR